ncbi:unnamed protein product [Caenorhabditis nigoni]
MLQNAPVLQKVTDKSNEENQQLSDRLQSIEASISKILKLNEDAEKSGKNYNANHNTSNTAPEKIIKLNHVFENANKFEEDVYHYSDKEEHFNVNCYMKVKRHEDHLGFFIHCEPIAPADKWSIRTKLKYKVWGPKQDHVFKTDHCYDHDQGWGWHKFQPWDEIKDWYLVDGNLTVEAKVTIIETTGLAKAKLRMFDESQKDVSDVILVVRDTKFYVSKMYLASQSSVFKALLLGGFSESKQSEVTLNGIDPDDFQGFLEGLYGEPGIDTLIKCEEFLLKESKKTLEKKLEIATRYHLKNVEGKKCQDTTHSD